MVKGALSLGIWDLQPKLRKVRISLASWENNDTTSKIGLKLESHLNTNNCVKDIENEMSSIHSDSIGFLLQFQPQKNTKKKISSEWRMLL